LPNSIQDFIEKIWQEAGAWPIYLEAMRRALNKQQGERGENSLASLPAYCCAAAGGDPGDAFPVAAAWLLFYTAAHLMDGVEDQDELDPWWEELGPGTAASAATGLYFTATLALNRLDDFLSERETPHELRAGILNRFLVMGSGQHLDLVQTHPILEQYWQIAGAKSGAFFAMACWAGARLATDRADILDGFDQFGFETGLLIQILDDLMEFRHLASSPEKKRVRSLRRSLPVVYTLEVCSEEERNRLNGLFEADYLLPEHAEDIVSAIEENGGVLYMLMELDRHRQLALDGLKRAQVSGSMENIFIALLDELHAPEE
jgi:geranylgeranyl pyrophosphate synthase